MIRHPILSRLTLSLALALSAASLVAFAGEASETTDIEVVANGVTEKVSIVDLAVGETRQLYSEAGTLVTATRTAESLELDIGGDKTSIRMLEPGAVDEAEIAALIEAHGDQHAGEASAHADGKRKVIVIKAGDGELQELDADEVLVEHLGEPGAKQVVVKRRLARPAATDSN
jgi:uncharacterized protein (DUF2141 family)